MPTRHGGRQVTPYAYVFRSTTQSFANNTAAALTFDTADDRWSMWDTAGKLTVPKGYGGLWVVSGGIQWAANATGNRTGEVVLNHTEIVAGNTGSAPSSGTALCSGAAIRRFAVGDTFEFFGFQSSGGALLTTIPSGSPQTNFLSAVWVAP